MDPLLPAVLTVRDFNVLHGPWNFFGDLMARMSNDAAQAEDEMRAMREQMLRLVPRDPTDTKLDVQHAEIQPRGHAVVEEKGETKLKLEFDVHQFKPEEVKVKVLGANILQVTADHEEKTQSGFQRRTFVRQYSLPKGVDAEHVRPTLTQDGVLTIEAKAPSLQPGERLIPIAYK
jgi:HSP20 family molecular chaperone IbpA